MESPDQLECIKKGRQTAFLSFCAPKSQILETDDIDLHYHIRINDFNWLILMYHFFKCADFLLLFQPIASFSMTEYCSEIEFNHYIDYILFMPYNWQLNISIIKIG
jgi:hypothetical protein